MRVICINNKPLHISHPNLNNIVEGEIYNVLWETKGIKFLGYWLDGIPCSNELGYRRCRFIPLSEIDEMETKEATIIVKY